MRQCTWVNCQNPASHPQIGQHGVQWADLCDWHNAEAVQAMEGPIKGVLAVWVKASGGAKKLASTF